MSEQVSRTKRGVKWSVVDQVVRQSVTLVISGILSRLLTPSDFGLLGMAVVAIGFLEVFKDIGLGASIVHKKDVSSEEKSTIFWTNVMLGGGLSVLLVISAPWISDFFSEPRLSLVLQVLSINFFIGAMSVVPDAVIQKTMDFRGFFAKNSISVLSGGVVGIYLAYKGFGVWALVIQNVVVTFLNLILSLLVIQWMPEFVFRRRLLRPHFNFSVPVLADSSFNYWVRNIDSILVGRLLGSVSLGIYNRAYSLMLLPVRQVSSTLGRVMFPSLSLIQQDSGEMWRQYTKMISAVAVISFPLMIFLGVYAEEVIFVVYGSQWAEAVPLFQILCVLGALQSIGTLSGPVFYAKGRTLLMFKVGLFSKSLMIVGIVGGLLSGGLTAMVWGYLIFSSIGFFVELFFLVRVLGKNLGDFFRNLLPEVFAAFSLLGILYLFYHLAGKDDIFLSIYYVAIHFSIGIVSILTYFFILKFTRSSGLPLILNNIYKSASKSSSSNAG